MQCTIKSLIILLIVMSAFGCSDLQDSDSHKSTDSKDKLSSWQLNTDETTLDLTCSPLEQGEDPNGIHDLGDHSHFEGWYYRFTEQDHMSSWVVIVAYWRDSTGADRAFIELLHHPSGTIYKQVYESFDIDYIQTYKGRFQLWVGDTFFSAHKIKGSFIDQAGTQIELDIDIDQCARWGAPLDENNRWTMGYATNLIGIPLKWHINHLKSWSNGVIKIDHDSHVLQDVATHQEKNWGRSFPSQWIWMQSNVFEGRPDVAFALAGGPIVNSKQSPDGYILGIRWRDQFINWRSQDGHLFSFKDVDFYIAEDTAIWTLKVEGFYYKAEVKASASVHDLIVVDVPADGGLKAGAVESLNAEVDIILSKRNGLGWVEFDRIHTSRAAVEAGGHYAESLGLLK